MWLRNTLFSSQGECRYAKGVYQGEWKQGRRDGKGRMEYPSGNVYDGEWKDNAKQGYGTMKWTTKNEEYEGEWDNNQPSGQGVYTWNIQSIRSHQFPLKNIYKGTDGFNRRIMEERETPWTRGFHLCFRCQLYRRVAKQFEGSIYTKVQHGMGRYITENGRTYSGRFENDRPIEQFNSFDNSILQYNLTVAIPFIFHLPEESLTKPKASIITSLNGIVRRHSSNQL